MSGSNLCFISNYSKTFLFDAVAQQLQEAGRSVYWIVVNHKLREHLLQRYDSECLLYLNKKYIALPGDKIGEFKLNELVYGDRALEHIPDEGVKYLLHIQKPIYDFIQTNSIHYVFGELTWAHELLIRRLVEQRSELRCRFLNPAGIRIPNGRFAFFTDECESQMLPVPGDKPWPTSEKTIAIEKPDYLAGNDQLLQHSRSLPERLKKMKRFVTGENIDAHDPTLIKRRWVRLLKRGGEEVNRELYRFVKRLSLTEVGERKFVFLALHKQPEASIDVIGRYYEDQQVNILNLWRITPDDWLVLVKEHSNAIGDRGPGFYRRLARLPNLYFIREDEDSHEIIQRSELVVTVSGTVAYEAALLGKPAVTLAPTFFNRAPHCRHVGLEDLRKARNIYDIIPEVSGDTAELQSYVMQHSFPGIISDPLSDNLCMHPDNISSLAAAVRQVTA
ncbi:MAG: hypothetical protein ABII79_04680 [bacterium]